MTRLPHSQSKHLIKAPKRKFKSGRLTLRKLSPCSLEDKSWMSWCYQLWKVPESGGWAQEDQGQQGDRAWCECRWPAKVLSRALNPWGLDRSSATPKPVAKNVHSSKAWHFRTKASPVKSNIWSFPKRGFFNFTSWRLPNSQSQSN